MKTYTLPRDEIDSLAFILDVLLRYELFDESDERAAKTLRDKLERARPRPRRRYVDLHVNDEEEIVLEALLRVYLYDE